jgi:hypothetical protein
LPKVTAKRSFRQSTNNISSAGVTDASKREQTQSGPKKSFLKREGKSTIKNESKKTVRAKSRKDAETDDSDPEGKDEMTLAKEAMNRKAKVIDDFLEKGGFEELLRQIFNPSDKASI